MEKIMTQSENSAEESRLATIGIIVDESEAAVRVNEILHEYGEHIVGRMGIPYRDRGVSVISIIADAPLDILNRLTGKLGNVKGASAKTMLAKI